MFAIEVETAIEHAVCEQKLNLDETKQSIFKNLTPHAADVKLVENCFIKVLIDCARTEFEKVINEPCGKKDFVDNFTRRSDNISTLQDLISLCQPGHYMTHLNLYSYLIEEYDLANFIANLKAYVWRKILQVYETGRTELEILQDLVVCFQTNTVSKIVHEKLEEFKENCASQARSGNYLKELMSTVEIKTISDRQLQRFLRSVKNLQSEYLFLENQLLQIIYFYLKPVEVKVKNIRDRAVVEIIGGIMYLSKELPKIEQELMTSEQHNVINELRFIAVHMFEIDCDLENCRWHGFNILIMATNVNVSKTCKWDLSGSDSQACYDKAHNGNSNSRDGDDGIDGCSGESSGNVKIIADQMQNAERLTVILNGGNGSDGQDGGDGANGKNGEGISMNDLKEKFPSPVHFWGRFHNLWKIYNEICSIGRPAPNWTKDVNCYAELKLDNGQKIIHSASKYISTNCYLLYKGSKGQPGGRGGLNGLGGEGGFQGECIAISKQDKSLFPINVKATKGCNGHNGKPGRNGEFGKNGWDVGYTDFQLWTELKEFGTSQNQRLAINYSTDSSDRVYCGYRYDALGSSMCYATIKESALEHCSLTENEKLRETCSRRLRQQHATATRKTSMQQSAMETIYGQHFEMGNNLINRMHQMREEAAMNFELIQRKAKTAFEEVEKLKERSREKVSRYQVYEAEKQMKKTIVKAATRSGVSREERKSQILKGIEENPRNDAFWNKLLNEEFSDDELQSVKEQFETYIKDRRIETSETRCIRQKFGLAKFHSIVRNDYLLPETDEFIQHSDFDLDKYLKICEESDSKLKQTLEFQDRTERNERIQNIFDELLQYRLSTDNVNIIRKCYDQLTSVKIGNENLKELLESSNREDEKTLEQTIRKLSDLKTNQNEWNKVLSVLDSLKTIPGKTMQMRHLVSIHNEKLQDLLKYLFDLLNQLRSLTIANDTLAKLIGLVIIEYEESENEDIRLQEYFKLHKNFLNKKQKSLDKILEVVRFLSKRPRKASWQNSHEYPNFLTNKNTEEVLEQELIINEELLQKLFDLYVLKQNETIDWHQYIDDKLLDVCLNTIKSNKSNLCASLLELFAWKYELNIKVYTQDDSQQFVYVREHFNVGRQVERLLLRNDQTIERLVIDQEFVKLGITRKNLILKFHLELQDKNYFPSNALEHSDDDIVIYKLCKFFKNEERDMLEDRLKKVSTQCIGANSILLSLLHSFMCNGCHLSSSEISLLINMVLECWVNFDQNPELFSYIVLSHSQFQMIDELILIKIENLLRRNLREKTHLRHRLKEIKDHSIKFILATKLQDSDLSINEELFSTISDLLSCIAADLIFLEHINLPEWPLALKQNYWQHGLSQGGFDFTSEGLEQISFYLVKLESLYGHELVVNLVNALTRTTMFSIGTLLAFVYRFYAEDTELSQDILTDFGIFNSDLSNLLEQLNKRCTGEELLRLCQRNPECEPKQFNYIKDLMIKLGFITSEDHNIERLIEMIEKSSHHSEVTKHFSKIKNLLEK